MLCLCFCELQLLYLLCVKAGLHFRTLALDYTPNLQCLQWYTGEGEDLDMRRLE